MKLNNTNKLHKFDGRQFVTIPKEIHESLDLNASEKIILSYIHNFTYEWNRIKTKQMKQALGFETIRTVQNNIQSLVNKGYLEARYYAGRNREFRSTVVTTKDAKIVIPGEILSRTDYSSTYKITYGAIVAASLGSDNFLGGYNFNQVLELAELLGMSISSVYRHINKLLSDHVIKRDESSSWLIIPLDNYSRTFARQQQRKLKDIERRQTKDKSQIRALTPEEDSLLDNLYSIL